MYLHGPKLFLEEYIESVNGGFIQAMYQGIVEIGSYAHCNILSMFNVDAHYFYNLEYSSRT